MRPIVLRLLAALHPRRHQDIAIYRVPPCPGGSFDPRNSQSVAIYRIPPCVGGALRPRSCQRVAIYRVRPLLPGSVLRLDVAKATSFIMFPPLLK